MTSKLKQLQKELSDYADLLESRNIDQSVDMKRIINKLRRLATGNKPWGK